MCRYQVGLCSYSHYCCIFFYFLFKRSFIFEALHVRQTGLYSTVRMVTWRCCTVHVIVPLCQVGSMIGMMTCYNYEGDAQVCILKLARGGLAGRQAVQQRPVTAEQRLLSGAPVACLRILPLQTYRQAWDSTSRRQNEQEGTEEK